jgi:hypothetical protein
MRGSFTGSLSRLAIVALVTSSFTVPLILDVSPAMARAAAGSSGTAGAAGGSTGGSTGGSGGGGATGNGGGVTTLSVLVPIGDPPRRLRLRAQAPVDTKDSCYQSQPMFDRWGDYVGKQQLPDFCY